MSFFDTSYSVILSKKQSDFFSQWDDCMDQLQNLAKESLFKVFKINIFIDSDDESDFSKKKQSVRDDLSRTFVSEYPTTSILPISPGQQLKISLEIGRVNSANVSISYKRYDDCSYIILEKGGYKELWVNGLEVSSKIHNTKNSSEKAFEMMLQILQMENMTFDNIIRQWNYIGSILKTTKHYYTLTQNYQEFNKTRFKYYQKFRTKKGYPAATGVGMNYNSVMIDFYAIGSGNNLNIITIQNPRQRNPYSYDKSVLAVTSSLLERKKYPPLFERAILITDNNESRIYISGTASITGQETFAIGNLTDQTMITIENVEKLISIENLAYHYPKYIRNKPLKYSRIRIYVKNDHDISKVKSLCTEYFGIVPAIYIQSDICRTNLLVEIEADLCA
jgi:hypothetical protein